MEPVPLRSTDAGAMRDRPCVARLSRRGRPTEADEQRRGDGGEGAEPAGHPRHTSSSQCSKASKLYGLPRKSATRSAASRLPPGASTRSRYRCATSVANMSLRLNAENRSLAMTRLHMYV